MGAKTLIFLIAVMVLISSCSIGDKTKPVVTDINKEVKQEAPKVEEKIENKTVVPVKVEEETNAEQGTINEKAEEKLPPSTHIITIKDLRLNPMELTIKKGNTVVWKHEDEWEKDEKTKHYLAAHTNEFRSPVLYYGDTFNHTFNKIGTFTYIDIIYKDRDYMRGKIIVE